MASHRTRHEMLSQVVQQHQKRSNRLMRLTQPSRHLVVPPELRSPERRRVRAAPAVQVL